MTIASARQTALFQVPEYLPGTSLIRQSQAAVREAAPLETRPDDTRAGGDSRLAVLVGKALLQVNGDSPHDDAIMLDDIPSHSTFGQWWSQLGRSMQSSPVSDWMRTHGIIPESVEIAPASGRISYQLRRSAPSTSVDDNGWLQVSGPVGRAAQIVGDGSSAPFKPPLSPDSRSAPLWLVKQFYKEQDHYLPAHAHERAAELLRDKAFPDLSGPRFATLQQARSEEELEQQKAVVGNVYMLNSLGLELNYLLERIDSGSIGETEIPGYLMKNTFEIHTDSSYRMDAGSVERSNMSLKEFISLNGWDIPTTPEAVENLKNHLLRPELPAPAHGNYGGALVWQPALDTSTLNSLRAELRHGNIGDIDLSGFENVLEYLVQGTAFEHSELGNPQRVLDSLILSPKAKALGAAIQAKFDAKSIKGSAIDWLLAALSVDQDSSFPVTDPRSRHWVAGFAVTGADTWGKPASTVISRLATHLVDTGKASSPEKALLQAHLLLSTRAPEFLVKNIPDQVSPGSHSWVSFVTAVKRIEAQLPGATAAMSYGQVMLQADVAPVSAQERHVEYTAQQEALKDWGFANGMPFPLTEGQMNEVRNAFNAQITELKAASEAQSTPMPSRKDMALEQLRKALPDMAPETLLDKSITLEPAHSDFPGPYSILDLYMEDALHHRPADNHWVCLSSAVDISEVLEKTKDLPNISSVFQDAFLAYAHGIEKSTATQVQMMISQLPLGPRFNLNYHAITIVREFDVYKDNFGRETRQRTSGENCLLVKTKSGDEVHTYEIDLKTAKITERTDLRDFKVGRQPSNFTHYHKVLEEVIPSGNYAAGLTYENIRTSSRPNSFNSDRTTYIANALVKEVDIHSFKDEAKGVTTFDTEVPFNKKVKEFLLNLIPLRSAIVNFQNGNIGEGIVDLTMDVFGFVLGVGAAARSGRALAAGASAFSKFAQGAKIVGRAALGSLNPLSGADDIARGVLNLGRKGLTLGRNGIQHLRGALRSVDLPSLAKMPGIAEGTYKVGNAADEVRMFARFDDATGNWHALNLQTRQPFGKPLENFQPANMPVETLSKNLQKLEDTTGNTGRICYEKAMAVGQVENALPSKTRTAVLNSLDTSTANTSNYTPRYKELMGVSPATTKSTFNPADITESGVINFVSRNEGGRMVHTAYIQKASDNKLYLYSTNQADLDLAMFRATGKVDTAAGALVSSLENDGLQNFLDKGYDFIFTPNSTLNSNVKRLAA